MKIKKILCLALIICFIFGLTACGKKDEVQISSFEELSGKNIAVELGSTNAFAIKAISEKEGLNVLYSLSTTDALSMLLRENVDAFAVDNIVAQTIVRRYPELIILPDSLDESGYGIALQKGNQMTDRFNEIIRQFKADGTLKALEDKWLGDGTDKTVPDQEWPASNGILRCRVSADMEPFCYLNEQGKVIGYDIDLLLMIAERLNCHIAFTTGEFSDLLPSLAAGQIDLVAGGITITRDRADMVDFTDQYIETSTVVIVRDVNYNSKAKGTVLSINNSFRKVFVENNRWKDFANGMLMSIVLVFVIVGIGFCLGFALYLLIYKGSKIADFILDIINKILKYLPAATWILAIYYIVFGGNSVSNFWAAVFAFSIMFAASVCGQLSGAIGAIDNGQIEAAASMGYRKFQALFKIFIPQALPRFFDALQGEIIGIIKLSSLVEFIGVLDAQTVSDAIRAETMEAVIPVVSVSIFYVVFTYLVSKMVEILGKKISRREKTADEIKKDVLRGKL